MGRRRIDPLEVQRRCQRDAIRDDALTIRQLAVAHVRRALQADARGHREQVLDAQSERNGFEPLEVD